MDIEELHKKIRRCKKCRLYKDAENAVPGEGPKDADIVLAGQNPGKKEDRTGRPFVGRAGDYLDEVLKKNGVDRKNIFITSIVKHRTPGNRKPFADEIKACSPYLTTQLSLINPKTVVLMGNAAHKAFRLEGMEYVETCHPAAAMRFPKMRKKFEDDFAKLKKKMR